MPSLSLAIVADDLTGALDAAAPFAAMPGGVVAATRPEALAEALASQPAVVAVSTRSREVPPGEARARVERVLMALPAGVRLFKKIDSRLKGNIAAELEPLGGRGLLVLPAIPDFGRIVRGGALQGFGADRPIPVRAALGRYGAAAEVPDTPDQATLDAAVAGADATAVLVGARGLGQALAAATGVAPPPAFPVLPAPLCFVVGSTDPITLAQAERLMREVPGAIFVAAPAGRVPEGRPGAVTLIQATEGAPATREAVARALAEGARPWLRAARSMLLSGGATAEAVLDALGLDVLTVAGEAQPGLAYCEAEGQAIVTKSGGFGAPDAFVRLAPCAAAARL